MALSGQPGFAETVDICIIGNGEQVLLVVRDSQMREFEDVLTRNFEGRVMAHLNEFFPRNIEALGQSEASGAVQYGIERARSYGFVAEQDICMYIDLMFAFGRDFDRDRQWAREVLEDPKIRDGGERAEVLFHTGMQQPGETATGIACPEAG